MAKVSIIVPVCNTGKYVDKCLTSLLNQTLDDIEIICIEDASNDNSAEILKKYEKKCDNIKCIYHKKRGGAALARKDGVLASTGKYIMFVDSDDFIEETGCENAYNGIRKNNTDIVQFNTIVENCANLPESRIESNQKALEPYKGLIKGDLLKKCLCDSMFSFTLWNKIYDGNLVRTALSKSGDYYFPKTDDLYGAFFILDMAETYSSIDDVIYHYDFGLGTTGHNTMTFEEYKKCCYSSWVYNELYKYVESLDYQKYKYTEVLEVIKEKLINEQIGKWSSLVPNELKVQALVEWEKEWNTLPKSELFAELANHLWNQKKQFYKYLVDFFQIKKTQKPIKTIALYYHCIVNGGAERVVAELCTILSKKYKVILVTDEKKRDNEYYINPEVERFFLPSFKESIMNYKDRSRCLYELIETHKIDAFINSQWLHPGAFWDALCIKSHKNNVAYITHTHSFCGTLWQSSYNDIVEYWKYYQINDAIITLSTTDQIYWSHVNDDVYYIPNPCLDNKITEKVNYGKGQKHILWIGRISGEKQPGDVVEIANYLKPYNIDAVFHIVGDGEMSKVEKLQNKIKEYELEDCVKLEGFHINPDEFYKKGHILLSTSEYEGFPLVPFEAASYGIPTILYDLPWVEYFNIIEGWHKVPQKDCKAAAEVIAKLLNNEKLWEECSEKTYNSFMRYKEFDILSMWSNVFENIKNGTSPEINYNKDSNRILFDQIALFHARMIEKTRDEQASIEKKKNKEIKKIKKSKRYRLGNKIADLYITVRKKRKNIIHKTNVFAKVTLPNLFRKKPKVSIIVPVYNCEKYLYESLNSLKAQTLKDIEILCVDDESTDNSLKILKDFEKNDSRFKVLTQKHANAGAARNLGIEKSQGEYLLFLDCDDIFDEDLCKKAYEKAKTKNADIVIYGNRVLDNVRKKIMSTVNVKEKVGMINKVFSPDDVKEKIFQISLSNPWTKLYKKKFVIKNGLEYHSTSNSNDVFFTRTAFVRAKRIVAMKDILVTYRFNSSTSTQGSKDKNPLAFYNEIKAVKDYLVENSLYDKYKLSLKICLMEEAVWNFNTMKNDESRKMIKDIIQKEGRDYFDLDESIPEDERFTKQYAIFNKTFK